jgi:peptidoglycan/LPS O-acetylase OafA/YrhL
MVLRIARDRGRASVEEHPHSVDARVPLPKDNADKLAFLDGLRGWASMWVVLNHLQRFLPKSLGSIPTALRLSLIMRGGDGVFAFFTISGFVIARSLSRSTMDGSAFRNFCARRVTRLTPPYYIAIFFGLTINYVSTRFKHETFDVPSVKNLPAHLLYLPDLFRMPMIIGIWWTLYLEMQFYLVLACVCWVLGRAFVRSSAAVRTVLLTGVGCAALTYPLLDLINGREHYFFPYLRAFMSGCFVFWVRQGVLHRLVFVGYFVALGAAAIAYRREAYVAAFAALALITLAAFVPGAMQRWLADPVSQFLGRISYSLYLNHASILGGVCYVATRLVGTSKSAELLLTIPEAAAALIVGYILYRWIERPAIAWSQSLRRRPAVPVAV